MADAPWKDAERCELDDAAVNRIAEDVARRGPLLARRGVVIHRVKRASAVAGAIAAIVIAWLITRPEPRVEPVLACNAYDPARGLDIGARGTVVAEGEVKLGTALPCLTVFTLEQGRITVHARDLGGGELAIVAGADRIVVRGTVFSVERTDATIVSTAEGVVEIVGRGHVRAGTRARIRGHVLEREQLDDAERKKMERALGLLPADEPPPPPPPAPKKEARQKRPPPPPKVDEPAEAETPAPPPPSVESLIASAQAAKRRGDLDEARRYFREAGQRTGPTAEAAWLGLARLELEARRPKSALAAIEERKQRFPRGQLELEAAWLEVRALADAGNRRGAERAAEALIRRWPESAQAGLARRFLEKE